MQGPDGKSRLWKRFALPVSAALLLLLIVRPALAVGAMENINPNSYSNSGTGSHCNDGGGTCTIGDLVSDNSVYFGEMTGEYTTNWWDCSPRHYPMTFTYAFSTTIPSNQVSAIAYHEYGQTCTHTGSNRCSTSYPADIRFCNAWSGTSCTGWAASIGSVGAASPYARNDYLCTSNGGCSPYVSTGPTLQLSHSSGDACDGQQGQIIDHMAIRVDGDLSPPTSACTVNCGSGWHNANFGTTFTCTDSGSGGGVSSGCNILWCYDTTNSCTPNVNGNSWGSCVSACGPTISSEGLWYVRWLAKDGAGHWELPSSAGTIYNTQVDGSIRNWITLGTFAESGVACGAGAPTAFISSADNYNRVSGYGEAGHTWTALNSGADLVDLTAQYGALSNVVAYALAYVWSDSSASNLELRLGSDDGLQAWVNGNLVDNNPNACRGDAKDSDIATGITLNAGWNTVLLRVGQSGGGWGYTARFAGAQTTVSPLGHTNLFIAQADGGGSGNLYGATHSIYVRLDKTAPTTTDNSTEVTATSCTANNWRNLNCTVSLSCSDPLLGTGQSPSGCSATQYCTSASPTCIPTSSGNTVQVTCNDGSACSTYVGYRSQDGAGNLEATKYTPVIRIDRANPSTSGPSGTQSWQNTNAAVTLTCSDTGSGCALSGASTNRTPSADGSLDNWTILGRFAESGVACGAGSPTAFISSSDNYNRRPGYSEAGQGWFPFPDPNQDDIVDLNAEAFKGLSNDNEVSYSNVYAWSPNARTGELRSGSDDGIQAWVNGGLVDNNANQCRGVAKNSDVNATSLNAGRNTLLVRVGNGAVGWGHTNRFTSTGGGSAWTDLVFSLAAYANPAWCVDTVNSCDPNFDYRAPVSITCATNDVCTRYLRYRSGDFSGNIEGATNSAFIRLDKLAPYSQGPIGEQGWFAGNQSVPLACVDPPGADTPTESGCAAGQPNWCIGSGCTPTTAYTGPVALNCNAGTTCAYTLRYRSTDVAGNVESAINETVIRIDNYDPSVTFSSPSNGSWFRRNFATTVADSDTDPVNSSGSGLVQTSIPGNALAGWWKFNDGAGINAADSSGNGNTGTLNGGATWDTTGQKVGAAAIDFDGTTGYVNVPDSGSLDLAGDNITITAWVYHTATQTGIIVNKESTYEFAVNGNTLQAAVETAAPGGWAWGGSQTIPLNAWTHVAFTYNGTYWRFYINGALVETIPPAGSQYGNIVSNANPLKIGARSGPASFFQGRIDDVRVYDEPLTADQINAIYTTTNTYADDANCYYKVESSADGSTWSTTQAFTARTCPSGSPTIGLWSNSNGEDCKDSGDPSSNGRCRVTMRTIDNVGRSVDVVRQVRIDWDSPYVNVTDPKSHQWETANFAVANTATDQPPGGVASGLNNCTLRVATIPSAGGAWTLNTWTTYSCGTNPTVTVGAGQQCPDQADNVTWPKHRATCLVVTGSTDALNPPNTDHNPSFLYYPLDENSGTVATDLGPRGINGTISGGGWTWASEGGYFRHGVNLAGTNDEIPVNLPSDLTGGPLTNFTVEFWAKPSTIASRGIFSFCQPSDCSGGSDRHIYTDASGDLCSRVWPHDGGGCSTSTLALNQWNHIALRVQKGVGEDLFLNGTKVRSVPAADHSDFDWATVMHIGRSSDAASPYFAGTVDEVKVHFRPLNDTEIAWAAQGSIPGPTSNDSEPGGAKHVRIDYTPPATPVINAPGAGSEQSAAFYIDVSDSDSESGLNTCQYRLQQPTDPNPNANIIRDWTARTCNSATSVLIPVGGGASDCQDTNPDPDIGTPCRVYVRAIDNAGLISASASRDFVINYITPLLRIEAPTDVTTVGLYNNSSSTCTGTVANCQNWWYARLRERGYQVTNASWSELNISNGLRAQGYSNIDYTGTTCGPLVTQNIDYGTDVGTNVFGAGTPCGTSTYSILWKGYIYIPTTASDWVIGFASADRALVFIDNTLVINDGTDHTCEAAPGMESSALTLSQGYHAIKVQYADNADPSCAHLYWRSATAGISSGTVVPSSNLYATKTPAYSALLNPYGEVFPGTGGPSPDPDAINIRDYVRGGSTWLESGGHSFYYPWTGAAGSAAHGQGVCADILDNGNQFINRTRNASNASSFHNAPSNYLVESVVPDRPSQGMYGNCGSTQKFRGLYVNQTGGARYGPALHCYGTGCVARTDDTAPGRWEAVPWNWSFGAPEAVRLRFTTSGVGSGTNSYVYRIFNSSLSYTIASGDQLQYDVWLDPGAGSIAGGFDALVNGLAVRDNTGWTDQNGLPIHPATDLSRQASGRWYHRVFDMSSKAGQVLTNFKIAYDQVGTQAVPAGTYELLLGNVVITDSAGRVKQVIHREGSVGDGAAEGPTADVTSYSVSTVAYAGAVPNVYADLLRHWVNQNWTIMLEDDDDSPGLTCSRQVRSAGAITVSNASRSCDNDLDITVGPNLNCRDQGDNQCEVDINTTNATGGAYKALKFGIDWTPPATSRDLSKTTPCAYRANTSWVYYSSASVPGYCPSGGTLTVTSGASDATSGVAYVSFPNTTTPGGITIWPGPHTWTYTFGSSSTFSGMATLYVNDNASNVNSTQFTVYRDITAPSGNTGPDYCAGISPCYNTSLGVLMNLPGVSDAESGVANFSTSTNPPLGRFLMRRDTALGGGACNAFSENWSILADDSASGFPPPAGGPYNDTTVQQGKCYQYGYNVSDNVANWVNTTSANTARIDITPPDLCGPVTLNSSSYYAYVNGTTLYYNNRFSGDQFNATVVFANDYESGIKNVTFPATTSAGWVNNSPGPYQGPYTWTTLSTFNGSTVATCYNNAGGANTTPFSVLRDIYEPTGNTGPSYTDGFYSVTEVDVTLPSTSDNFSGIPNSGHVLQRREATLSNAVCGTYGPWSDIAYDPISPYPDDTNASRTGHCYQYSYNVTDWVHNWNNTSSTHEAKIDTTAPANGSIDYPNGYWDIYPDITWSKGDDPESGISDWQIWRSTAPIDCAGNPQQFGPWNLVVDKPAASPYTDNTVLQNTAYQWKLVVTNGAGITTEYYDPTGDIFIYKAFTDPNITKQLDLYRWNATYIAANPVESWAFHNNSTGVPPDGFTVTQTATSIQVYRPGSGTRTFSGFGVSGPFPETHSYTVAYDYACGSGNYTYVYRDGTYVGRWGGGNLSHGDIVKHLSSVNTQVNSMIVSPGRWDPPLSFTTAATNASGCTNYVLDSCLISGARPCVDSSTDPLRARSVNGLSVNRSVVRPGADVQVSTSFTCLPATGNATSISYNAGNGAGWTQVGFRTDCNAGLINHVFSNAGNPGVHRVRASVGDSAESGSWLACRMWSADNDDVAFWVAEPVPG